MNTLSTYIRKHETPPDLKKPMTGFLCAGVALFALSAGTLYAADNDDTNGFLPNQMIVSTVPANGDLNPYGVAFVPSSFQIGNGPLHPGDILVSNFNNSNNLQGTGTTIVRVSTKGVVSKFFAATPPAPGATGNGLSTALAVLRKGVVIVGSVPSVDGTAKTVGPGGLLVVDSAGNLVQTISDPKIKGPWDMTVVDEGNQAIAFVSNVLNGTILRLNLNVATSGVTVTGETVIASGYKHRGDPAAFEVGPTGLVYNPQQDVLYVASTDDNAVFAVQQAATRTSSGGTGTVIYKDATHLHGPLGMIEAPNGHLLAANSDVINPNPAQPSEIDEFTKQGQFIKQLSVDPAFGGSFGLAVRGTEESAFFAAVDDNTATLTIWNIR
jgi:hypothetical protein